MRLALLLLVVGSSAAFALPGDQVSKITLGAEEATRTLTAPPPPVQPLPPSMFGSASSEPLSAALRMRLLAMEIRMLRFSKNDLVAPIFLSVLGGTGVLVGLSLFAMTGSLGYGAFIVGLVVLMISGAPLLIGIPWLIVALGRNAAIDRELVKLETEFTMLGGQVGPTSRREDGPQAGALVASF